jgi:hypothetical protein
LCAPTNWTGRDWTTAALLDAAEAAGFDLMVTCDQNLPYQQNLTGRKLALVVLSSNRWPTLRKIVPRICRAVDFVQTGRVVRVELSEQ